MMTHSKPTCRALIVVLIAALLLPANLLASDKPRPAPPIKPVAEYPMREEHETEHVTIAADVCDDTDDCKFFRNPYVSHGFVAVRVIVANDRDEALILDDVRIQFQPAEGDKEAAATDEDLNRRLFSQKQAQGTRIPIIGMTVHHEPVDSKIVNDGNDFGFASTTVPPHSVRAGYVFYDTKSIEEPVLKGAELYLKMIHYTDSKNVKHELFPFTLPFDKWLAAQPKPEPRKKLDDGKS